MQRSSSSSSASRLEFHTRARGTYQRPPMHRTPASRRKKDKTRASNHDGNAHPYTSAHAWPRRREFGPISPPPRSCDGAFVVVSLCAWTVCRLADSTNRQMLAQTELTAAREEWHRRDHHGCPGPLKAQVERLKSSIERLTTSGPSTQALQVGREHEHERQRSSHSPTSLPDLKSPRVSKTNDNHARCLDDDLRRDGARHRRLQLECDCRVT